MALLTSADLFIRAGDTSPAFTDTILTAAGEPYNLTGKTVTLTLRSLRSASPVKLANAVTVVTPASGAVKYEWATTDTAAPGLYNAEWHVTTDGYTHPNNGYRVVSIEEALATAPQELVTVAECREYGVIPAADPSQDAKLLRFIRALRPVVEAITGPVIPQKFDEWYDGGTIAIRLRHRPRVGPGTSPLLLVMACSEYLGPIEWPLAIVASPDLGQLYSCQVDSRLGRVVRRTAGGGTQPYAYGAQAVHVQYEAGQETVPDNVIEGTLELIRNNFQRTQQAQRMGGPYGQAGGGDAPDIDEAGVGRGLVWGKAYALLSPTKRHPSLA